MNVQPRHNQPATFFTRLSTFSKLATITAALIAVAGVSGCGKNAVASSNANIRAVNVAPESGALNIVIDVATTNLQSAIAYKTATGFAEVANGSRRFRISNSGGVVLDQTITTAGQQKQLLVIYGGASSLGMSLLSNDITNGATGNTKFRLANYAVGLGLYDVYVVGAAVDFTTVEPIARGTAATLYEVVAGTYSVILTSPNTKDVLFRTPARAMDAQQAYNLGLFNEGSGELPSAFWVKQNDDSAPEFIANPIARIRATNAQSTVPTANVSVDGTRIFTNVTFGGISNYARTTSGAKVITYTDTANAANVYTLNDTFVSASDYSTFLSTDPATGTPSVFRIADKLFPPTGGKVRVRLVNASTIADLSLALAFTSVTPTIATRAASNYVEVTGGLGTPATITQGAAATPVLSLAGIDLVAGGSYSLVVSGTAATPLLSARQDK